MCIECMIFSRGVYRDELTRGALESMLFLSEILGWLYYTESSLFFFFVFLPSSSINLRTLLWLLLLMKAWRYGPYMSCQS
jgi:hypothetical protein